MMKQKLFRTAAAVMSALMLPAMSGVLPCAAAPALTLYGDLNKDGAVNAADAALILQYAAAVGAGYTGTLGEYLDPPSTDEDGRIQRAAAYLEASFNDLTKQDYYLTGDPIYGDADFSCTWDISDYENFDDADRIELRIAYMPPDPLGKYEELALTVKEVFLDDVKVENLTGEPKYASRTDHGFETDDVTDITFALRNAVFDDLDAEFTESVRIVFTLEGLSALEE